MNKFFRAKGSSVDAMWLSIVRVVTMLIGLICVKIISVYFSLAEYAIYAQATLVISTVCSFSILGLTDAVNFFYNTQLKQERTKEHYLATIFGIQTLVGGIAALLILFGSNFLIDYFKSPELRAAIIWIAFQPLLQNYSAMLQVLFISVGRARHIAFVNFVISLAKISIFSVATFYTGSIITILALTLVMEVLQVLYLVIDLYCHGVVIKLRKFCVELCMPIMSYAIPMAAFILINALLRDTDKWVIGYFAPGDELAIYTNCSRVLPFDLITASFFTVLVPIITKYIVIDKPKVCAILNDYLNLGLVLTCILVLSAICYSKDLLLLLYDEKYLSGLSVFVIYLFVDLIRFANITILFSASGKTKELLIIVIGSFIVNLLLAIVLYKSIGLIGPAMATLFTMLLSYTCYFKCATKILDYPIIKLLSLSLTVKLVLGVGLIGAVGLLISRSLLDGISAELRFLIMYPLTILILCSLYHKDIFRLIKNINALRI